MAGASAGQTILVLGGGIGGVVTANRLRRTLDRRHRVVLVDREPTFSFAASYLWVMTGERNPRQTTRPLRRLARRGAASTSATSRRSTPRRAPPPSPDAT
jgi:NADH dehydrogenase FAD-containing subunit